MARTTRTLNPLHFEDLEPHRFEDMVRQLAYEFRDWSRIEATGRLGADEGMDIRALARISDVEVADVDDGEDDGRDGAAESFVQRVWIIQCNREKRLGPSDLRRVVKEAARDGSPAPYGLVIAAAADFSRKARDAALNEARERGVQEVIFWAKAELEDALFQPKNDHLLFAYFGISLQVRRRVLRTDLRARLTTKRRLVKLLGDVQERSYQNVLLRDVSAEDYPEIRDKEAFVRLPRWRYYQFTGHRFPDHLAFVVRRFHAIVRHEADANGGAEAVFWDAAFEHDTGWPGHPEVHGLEEFLRQRRIDAHRVWSYWHTLPDEDQAWFERIGFVHYGRILVADEFGDVYNEGPHLLIDYEGEKGPFDWYSEIVEFGPHDWRHYVTPKEATRRTLFPDPLPEPKKPNATDGVL